MKNLTPCPVCGKPVVYTEQITFYDGAKSRPSGYYERHWSIMGRMAGIKDEDVLHVCPKRRQKCKPTPGAAELAAPSNSSESAQNANPLT